MQTTESLLRVVQESLTRAMIERSANSGGLPKAHRSLLLSLSELSIGKGESFRKVPGPTIVGRTLGKYYLAGDRPLGEDLANMSAEPFPLITSHTSTDTTFNEVQNVTSFKNKIKGTSTSLRYMVVQLSKLGYEFMKYYEYFPQTYSMDNTELVHINFKSHVPADLFRTTTLRSLGRGADMYPMNPSEIFYTMYQMLEEGYDIPVSKLEHFKGFDTGDRNNIIYMKPEALASLFDIGISTFIERIQYTVDLENNRIIFHSCPSKERGSVFINRIQKKVESNNFRVGAIQFDSTSYPIPGMASNALLVYNNVRFLTQDLEQLNRDIMETFHDVLFVKYYHYSHSSEPVIENSIETDIKLETYSVREILIDSIENFKEIKRKKYQREIDKEEEALAEHLILEKVTRPYLAPKIQELLRETDDVRVRELKKFADAKHQEDPENYPEISTSEIVNYIWNKESNVVLANLNSSGHLRYRDLIQEGLYRIEQLEERLKEENIKKEISADYLALSRLQDFNRKTPVLFLNDALELEKRALVIDMANALDRTKLDSPLPKRALVFHNYPITSVTGENLPKDYYPTYTIRNLDVVYHYDREGLVTDLNVTSIEGLSDIVKDKHFNTPSVHFAAPYGRVVLYLTSKGAIGIWGASEIYGEGGTDPIHPSNGSIVDMVDITSDWNNGGTSRKLVYIQDGDVKIAPLSYLIERHKDGTDIRITLRKSIYRVTGIDLLDTDEEKSNMYTYSRTKGKIVNLAYATEVKDLDCTGIYSGNKRAYIGGVHVPVSIVNRLAGTNLIENKNKVYYPYTQEMRKYVTILFDKYEENSEADIKQIEDMIGSFFSPYGGLQGVDFEKLLPFYFIRELS